MTIVICYLRLCSGHERCYVEDVDVMTEEAGQNPGRIEYWKKTFGLFRIPHTTRLHQTLLDPKSPEQRFFVFYSHISHLYF